MASPEEKYYSDTNRVDAAVTADPRGFQRGGRYRICHDSLTSFPMARRELAVELGCGNGGRLVHLREQFDFKQALGVDFSFEQSVERETERFIRSDLNQRWPVHDNSADVIVAMMVIEHLFDPFFCFGEVARVLHPEGRAFVNLPLVTGIKNRMRLALGALPTTSVAYRRWFDEKHWDGFHLHYFNLGSIRDLATQSNLRIASLRPVGRLAKIKSLMPSLLCGEISFELRRLDTARAPI